MNASLSRLRSFYGDFKTPLLLHAMIKREFPGNIAVLTTFTPEAGLLLAMVAEIDPAIPVLFPESGSHSLQTQGYARLLERHLGLMNLRRLPPVPGIEDWKSRLSETLESLSLLAIITGRRHPGLPLIELDENGVFRINPLAGWTKEAQNEEMNKRSIPPHPHADAPEKPENEIWPYAEGETPDTTEANWSV